MEVLAAYSKQRLAVELLAAVQTLTPTRMTRRAEPNAKQAQHRLRVEEVVQMTQAYEAGALIRELAEQYSVDRTTVMAHLDRQGVPTRYRRLDPGQIAEAVQFYPQGWSLRKLASRYEVTDNTVRNALLAAGVQTRPRPGVSR